MMSLLDMEATVSWCDTGSSLSKSPILHLSVLLDKIGRVSATLGNFSFFLQIWSQKSSFVRGRDLRWEPKPPPRKRKKRKKNWSDPESGKMSATDASNKFKGPFSVFVEYFLISYCTPTPHKRTLSLSPATSSLISLSHTHTHTHTLSHKSSPACFYSSNPKQLHFPK